MTYDLTTAPTIITICAVIAVLVVAVAAVVAVRFAAIGTKIATPPPPPRVSACKQTTYDDFCKNIVYHIKRVLSTRLAIVLSKMQFFYHNQITIFQKEDVMSRSRNRSIGVSHRDTKNWTRRIWGAGAAALAGAMLMSFAVGCGDDGDETDIPGGPNNPDGLTNQQIDNNLGAGASRLVGDWEFIREGFVGAGDNDKLFASFSASGDLCQFGFQKVNNFWIEGRRSCMPWRVEGNYFIVEFGEDDSRIQYNISGNTVTTTECWYDEYDDEEECWTSHATKANIAAFRNSAGTIHIANPALIRTDWRLDNAGGLEFYTIWFYLWPTSRYFDDSHEEWVWYTNGNRLFLIGASETDCRTCTETYNGQTETWDCDCALISEETIEFTYTHTPGVSLRLRNIDRNINDLWEYQSWDDYMYKRPDNTNRRANSLFGIGRKSSRDR